MATAYNFDIVKGATFEHVLRWESAPYIYKAISGITKAAPAVVSSTSHGVPNGWRVAVVSVKGMTEINAKNDPPRTSEYKKATVLTAGTIELNDVNSSEYTTYTSGGYVQFLTPVSLTAYTARMSVKDKVGGTELFRLDTTNARIVISTANYTITLVVSATDTAALTFKKGVYDLEMVSGSGIVTPLLSGVVNVLNEVTTT